MVGTWNSSGSSSFSVLNSWLCKHLNGNPNMDWFQGEENTLFKAQIVCRKFSNTRKKMLFLYVLVLSWWKCWFYTFHFVLPFVTSNIGLVWLLSFSRGNDRYLIFIEFRRSYIPLGKCVSELPGFFVLMLWCGFKDICFNFFHYHTLLYSSSEEK